MKVFGSILIVALVLCIIGCCTVSHHTPDFRCMTLTYDSCVDAALQEQLESIDTTLRHRFGMNTNQTAVGIIDLNSSRLAMVRPDQIEYAASVPKIGILFAFFALNPDAAVATESVTQRELGLMIKASDNEMAVKYSRALGLENIQAVLNQYGFYDAKRGGGIWVGKHYGKGTERHGDPVADHSHAATVRQLLRFYLLLEQDRLVSTNASRAMREIFDSPLIPHLDDKFVKGLEGRPVHLLRKSGWWEDWFHDTAVVTGRNRHYIIVGLTHHPKGEMYLQQFAKEVDDRLTRPRGD